MIRKYPNPPKNTIGDHAATAAEKFDLFTKTTKILSININENPIRIPIARLIPIPPLRLTDDTDTDIRVRTNTDIGKLYLLCLTNKCWLINLDPDLISDLINLFNSKRVYVSASYFRGERS